MALGLFPATPISAAACVGPTGQLQSLCTANASIHIPVEYLSFAPVLIMSGGGLLLLLVSSVLPKRTRPGLYPALTVLTGAVAAIVTIFQWNAINRHGAKITVGGQIVDDHFSVLFFLLVAVATILGGLFSDSYLRREGLDGVEGYVLMLWAGTGAMLMAASAGLVILFLGLEILSIPLYVLAAYHRRRDESGEAGLKYFLLGAFSSAIFLYGVALTYGATGSTQFSDIAGFLARNTLIHDGVLLGGMVLMVVGLGFKVAAVPFHFWTPDVYQGSPTPFTGYMAAVAKAAGFAGLIRVLDQGLISQESNWRPAIWLIAVLTLLVGSVLAIAQRDLKRMLAYSSISQAGYVLVGLQAASARGVAAAAFFVFTYTFIIAGSFAVVGVIQGEGEARNDLYALRGLGRRRPLLAGAMLVFLLAQAGVPLTSGFLAKFYVIAAVVERGGYTLAVIAMLAAAIAAFFYLRAALLMYAAPLDEAGASADTAGAGAGAAPVGAGATAASVGVATTGAGVTSAGPGATAAGGETGGTREDGVSMAGLAPVASLDDDRPDVATLTPSQTEVKVPPAVTVGLAVCVAFTIFAGVSAPVIDYARHATLLLL